MDLLKVLGKYGKELRYPNILGTYYNLFKSIHWVIIIIIYGRNNQ